MENAVNAVAAAIDKKLKTTKGPILVALDGRSGSGKTTLSELVGKKFNSTVILADDFYSGGSNKEWARKTARQKAEQVIDWRRLRKDVLEPLLAGQAANFHPFDWKTWDKTRSGSGISNKIIKALPADVIILDCAYSSRPELADIIDLTVLVTADDKVRRERLKKREGEQLMADWHSVWDEAEDYYFTQVRPPSAFDLIVEVD